MKGIENQERKKTISKLILFSSALLASNPALALDQKTHHSETKQNCEFRESPYDSSPNSTLRYLLGGPLLVCDSEKAFRKYKKRYPQFKGNYVIKSPEVGRVSTPP